MIKSHRIKYLYLAVIVLPFILGACSLKSDKKSTDQNDWKNEVLMAQECGMDGLMCCPDKDPKCQFGQECCVDPNGSGRDYCSDSCDFGTEGSFCRVEGEECDAGLVCNEGNCRACGAENQPCCASAKACGSEFICHNDTCLKCGLPGNPCCGNEKVCLFKEEYNSRIECRNDLCAFCGSSGGASCSIEPSCDKSHLLNNGVCLPCGNYNQPCCRNEDSIFCNEVDLECKAGFCANK